MSLPSNSSAQASFHSVFGASEPTPEDPRHKTTINANAATQTKHACFIGCLGSLTKKQGSPSECTVILLLCARRRVDQNTNHENTKVRNHEKNHFVISYFRVFVIRISMSGAISSSSWLSRATFSPGRWWGTTGAPPRIRSGPPSTSSC